ncbi:uncharacterized protein LOC103374930 [Stegastes partitus]|uniref:Uncharacterized protein LOC103374930 n=1 Tax=Stegastes partitus TaxID=144197 RepID=A0A9Y4NTM8_9TELE|nr:PREDICTED: uncharacterized protein LOC103374930 [Stegastes partitus]
MPTNQSSPWGDGPSDSPGDAPAAATKVPLSPTKDDGETRTSSGASGDGGSSWRRFATATPHLEILKPPAADRQVSHQLMGSSSPGGRSQQAAAGDAPIRGQRPLQLANQPKLEVADSSSSPPPCLSKPQRAALWKDVSGLNCKRPETRSTRTRTTRRSHSAKLTTKRCQAQNGSTKTSQLLVRGGPPPVLSANNRTNRTRRDGRGPDCLTPTVLSARVSASREETPSAVPAGSLTYLVCLTRTEPVRGTRCCC